MYIILRGLHNFTRDSQVQPNSAMVKNTCIQMQYWSSTQEVSEGIGVSGILQGIYQ